MKETAGSSHKGTWGSLLTLMHPLRTLKLLTGSPWQCLGEGESMGPEVSMKHKAEATAMTPQEWRPWVESGSPSLVPAPHLTDIVLTHGGDGPEHQLLATDTLESLLHLAQKNLILQKGCGRKHVYHSRLSHKTKTPNPLEPQQRLRTLQNEALGRRQHRVTALGS